jgi:hypothetical protein
MSDPSASPDATADAAALIDALSAATALLGQRRFSEAAGALERAAVACDTLAAAGVRLPAELVWQARSLHTDCDARAVVATDELRTMLQRVGTSRRAAHRYRRAGLR